MSVRQHKSGLLKGRWLVDYYARDGKRIRWTLPELVKTREQAEKFADNVQEKDRSAVRPTAQTISGLWPSFEKYIKAHMAERTLGDMRMSYKSHVLPHLGRFRLMDLSQGHFDMYKTERLRENGGARSINKEIAYIRSMAKWAAERGLCAPLAFRVRLLKYSPPKPNVLSPDEVVRLCENTDLLHRCLFLCLYEGAMRSTEALSLRWADIWWDQRLISVKGKGGAYRLVPLDGWLEQSLKEYRKMASWEGPVFLNRRTGKAMTRFNKALAGAAKRAKIKRRVTAHLLRHSQATAMAGANVNLRHIQTLLGHKSLKTTEIYMHLAADQIRGSMVKLPITENAKLSK